MIDYIESSEFRKDFKRLSRKFSSLNEDLIIAKKACLELYHLRGIDNQSVFKIQHIKSDIQVFKLKKFACKSLKGSGSRSGIRIIYAWFPSNNEIHFIEIYYKGDKENEDKARIHEYLKKLNV